MSRAKHQAYPGNIMYTFIIKDNGPGLDIIVTRAMLALAALACILYRSDAYYLISLLSALLLFFAAVFIKQILVRLSNNKFMLVSIAAVFLLIATHSVAFAVILLLYGLLLKFFYREPTIEISREAVAIRRPIASPSYGWNEFSNIILKDGLLTLDFKNNKLIQVAIDEEKTAVDVNEFNGFCNGLVQPE